MSNIQHSSPDDGNESKRSHAAASADVPAGPCDVRGERTHHQHDDQTDRNDAVTLTGGSRYTDAQIIPSSNCYRRVGTEQTFPYSADMQVAQPERLTGGGALTPSSDLEEASAAGRGMDMASLATVIILFVVNLLNYMDRFTIAGVLPKVQAYYSIDNSMGGLLQTSFVCSYMVFAPIFGFLGDRYNRKIIMGAGITFWSLTTFAGSFVPQDYFGWFMACRGFVGIGEASYSTIAPTIIADIYKGTMRSRMLALFYFAIPVGSGLGYITGSNVAALAERLQWAEKWHWALRVTPPLGLICAVLVIVVMKDPPRGESEGGSQLPATSWIKDLQYLIKNPSFMWSTLGFTCVAFVAGALSWWGPTFLQTASKVLGEEAALDDVSLKFGIITVVAGILGVAGGSFTATKLKVKHLTADPLVCAFGMIGSMPFLFFGAIVSRYNTAAAYALIFFGELLLCLNWSLVADILLYVVIPTRRSTAEAFQILFSHAFGDAGSPYILGMVSEALKEGKATTALTNFLSLEYALFITCFVSVLGGFCFLVTAWYIVEDKRKADDIIKGLQENGLTALDMSPVNGKLTPDLDMSPVNGKLTPDLDATKVVNGVPRTSL